MSSQQASSSFQPYLRNWSLIEDGAEIETSFSRLLPVRRDGEALMLKLLLFPEERSGSRVLQWWEGEGAARVVKIENHAVLLERAMGGRSLTQMVVEGHDDDATRILADTTRKLHRNRDKEPPDEAVSLDHWFRALWEVERSDDPFLERAKNVARKLIDEPISEVVLHGDIHHGNVLDFGERGWLAIDPKGLVGERGFDFANIFRNPPTGHQFEEGRMERMADVISEETGIAEERLLRWVVAFTGLSLAWNHGSEDELGDRVIGESAAKLLGI